MASTLNSNRIQSIDLLRGIIMIIMALDHVRDFFHIEALTGDPTNLATTTPALFFTRWITHFCAPIFLFLSGISAYLSGQKKSKEELSNFLIKRGVWLLLVEVAIITLAISFNPLYNIIFLQVIWAIGWSMIILGFLVRTSLNIIAVVGVVLFFGLNLFDYFNLPSEGVSSVLIKVLFTSSAAFYPIAPGHVVAVLYAILPWTAVMLLGYSFGAFYKKDMAADKRKKVFLIAGSFLILFFVGFRFFNLYGEPFSWKAQKNELYSFMSFLNVTKYPCSLLYKCMTIGPALIFLALTENIKGRIVNVIAIYGKVPFFYYVCHFYFIHLICVGFFFASGREVSEIVDTNSPFLFRPVNFGYSLPTVYAIWLLVILILYIPCKKFNMYKQSHKDWWLSYT